MDIGGTSTDCAFVVDGVPELTGAGKIEDMEISFPLRTIHTLGAGGGTIAKVKGGRFELGPESSGAAPGPACFGFGGEDPTVTDACVVVGYFSTSGVLAGKVTIDGERAVAAIKHSVADPLRISVDEAASIIRDSIEEKVASQLREQLERKGKSPQEYTLAAFGGAGPAFACGIAERLGVRKVIVPSLCSVFSAFGVSTSNVVHSYVETVESISEHRIARVRDLANSMRRRAQIDMKGEGFSQDDVSLSWDVSLIKASETVFQTCLEDIEEWLRLGERLPDDEADDVKVKVVLRAKGELPQVSFSDTLDAPALVVPRGHREVVWGGGRKVMTPIYHAEDVLGRPVGIVGPSDKIEAVDKTEISGPAVIEAVDTTIVVPYQWKLKTDVHRQFILSRED